MTQKTILIVDDSSSIQVLLKITLTGAGYEVISASSGPEALSLLTGQPVHLIISDYNMGHMNGTEFCREVKNLSNYQFTPVCMLTTESMQSKMLEGKKAGINAWLTKPFKPESLLSTVEKLIG